MKLLREIVISGKVQGVFFRASAKRKAEELDIKGTVRNEKDGTVYIEAEGLPDSLNAFIDWCHLGPPGARVNKAEIREGAPKGYESFEITR